MTALRIRRPTTPIQSLVPLWQCAHAHSDADIATLPGSSGSSKEPKRKEGQEGKAHEYVTTDRRV